MTIFNRIAFTFFVLLAGISSANAHDSHTHQAPWQACADKQIKEACSYTNGDEDLFKGSCQLFNEALMCVRNEPIIHVKALAKAAEKEAKQTAESKVTEATHTHH
ncbi:hypothetical protein ACPUVO_06375 [Pseudocolwellia sp. HL-MZ19]|uniref:hypothetical protein n=1 Tax=unclassified Pseudocolwellia TaxID=2848178 RepID=UPI003CF4C012